VTQCREVKPLLMRWDGSRISAVFEARLLTESGGAPGAEA
jgi:hypothetical protein